jgi:hypothetical protein
MIFLCCLALAGVIPVSIKAQQKPVLMNMVHYKSGKRQTGIPIL